MSVLAVSSEANQAPATKVGVGFDMGQRFYHGSATGKIGRFIPSKAGSFGEGIYFANYECAWEYADGVDENITSVNIKAKNPYFYSASYDSAEKLDIDSYAIDLVMSLFDQSTASSILSDLRKNEFCHLYGEVKERLKQMGHDCLVVIYEEDESFEVVVFENESVEVLN